MLQIEEVLSQVQQGMSGPYLCKAEDGNTYYVKGRHSGRKSQICELIGWHLANAFGLPVPAYSLLEVSEDLQEELPPPLKGIGLGTAFGSMAVEGARWCEQSDLDFAQQQFRRDLLIFDYWVHNEDRCDYNTNLLIHPSSKQFSVIDHNRIFEFSTPVETLLTDHVFSAERAILRSDLCLHAEYATRLSNALQAWDEACDNLPPEWMWANDERDVPVNFNVAAARLSLSRFENHDFWGKL